MYEFPRGYSLHSGFSNMLLHCEDWVRANLPPYLSLIFFNIASLHTLEAKGRVRGACFSSDGNLIFAWTWTHTQNLWHIWDCASTIDPIMVKSTPYTPVIHLPTITPFN